MYLSGDPFDVGDVYDFLLFEDLNCYFFAGGFVDGELDLAKSPLAQGLLYLGLPIPTRYSPMRFAWFSSPDI